MKPIITNMVHIDFFLDEDKELSEKQKEQFERLVKKAKELAKNGYVRQALELYQKALKIYHNEKLVNRINKMEVKLFCTTKCLFYLDLGWMFIVFLNWTSATTVTMTMTAKVQLCNRKNKKV